MNIIKMLSPEQEKFQSINIANRIKAPVKSTM
jgi:hypothetical protein